LVAVSKTKPPELVKACYDNGHLHFGENYIQEFVDKAAKVLDNRQILQLIFYTISCRQTSNGILLGTYNQTNANFWQLYQICL